MIHPYDIRSLRHGVNDYSGFRRARYAMSPRLIPGARPASTEWFGVSRTVTNDVVSVNAGRVYINSNGGFGLAGSISNKPQVLNVAADPSVTIGPDSGYVCLSLDYTEADAGDDYKSILAFSDADTEDDAPLEQVESDVTPGTFLWGANLWSKVRFIAVSTPAFVFVSPMAIDETSQIILAEVTEVEADVFLVEQRHSGIVSIFPGPHCYGKGGD